MEVIYEDYRISIRVLLLDTTIFLVNVDVVPSNLFYLSGLNTLDKYQMGTNNVKTILRCYSVS